MWYIFARKEALDPEASPIPPQTRNERKLAKLSILCERFQLPNGSMFISPISLSAQASGSLGLLSFHGVLHWVAINRTAAAVPCRVG